jgi:hypothetical protein
MVMVFYVFCCVLCVVVSARGGWFSWVSTVGSYSKYDILYFGIVPGVGISHTQSLSNIWQGKTAGEKKMTNQLYVFFPNGKYETYI